MGKVTNRVRGRKVKTSEMGKMINRVRGKKVKTMKVVGNSDF